MEREYINLLELQQRLRRGIEQHFPDKLWIKAEISSLKARRGGHCYLELSQSDDNGLVAKASAVIWSSRYRFIGPYFESVTGSPLQEGLSVLIQCQVTFSEIYGLALSVTDIDPAFSLGEQERVRRQTVARLEAEGLMGLQSRLSLPRLPRRFAVISAEDAAGYRDFIRHLHENPYGFDFSTTLFPARMQGTEAPATITAAIDTILASGGPFDLILLLRGGGSVLDLSCYDDYSLCAAIARCPIPVFTAIGHDQDHHIADMVANTCLKTPTALADEIIGWYADEDAALSAYVSRLRLAFASKISAMENRLNMLETRIFAADPRNIVKRGYILALDTSGVPVRRAGGRSKGEALSLMFTDGTVSCTVTDITLNDRAEP